MKLIPGTDGKILDMLASSYDGLIIESFGVGGLPNYGNDSFLHALSDWMEAGKLVCTGILRHDPRSLRHQNDVGAGADQRFERMQGIVLYYGKS